MQKGFVKTSKQKKSDEYNYSCFKNDTLLLADVFENFREMCLKIYYLDPSKFVSSPGLAWKVTL